MPGAESTGPHSTTPSTIVSISLLFQSVLLVSSLVPFSFPSSLLVASLWLFVCTSLISASPLFPFCHCLARCRFRGVSLDCSFTSLPSLGTLRSCRRSLSGNPRSNYILLRESHPCQPQLSNHLTELFLPLCTLLLSIHPHLLFSFLFASVASYSFFYPSNFFAFNFGYSIRLT